MNKYSRVAALFCCCLFFVANFLYFPRWKETQPQPQATLSWDVSGYYMYLPAMFIYHDLGHLAFKDSITKKYNPQPFWGQAFMTPSGNYIMKYTAGQAVLMSPYFFIGHAIAKSSHTYPADGFSFPYQAAIGIGMMLYAFLGIWVLRKVLLRYFADVPVALTLIALAVGSNLLNYAGIDTGMTHSPLFAIYSLLLLVSIRFYDAPSVKRAVAIGALCGLAGLIRPTEVMIMILPILWGISTIKEIRGRILFFFSNLRFLIAAVLPAIAIMSIQPLYWKLIGGHWIIYSYQDEGFSFLQPHTVDFMFSYSCGWLTYAPMLYLSFIGIAAFWKRKQNRIPILLFMFLSLYLASAWDIWTYGGTSGRAMVQSYPIYAFPIAALISAVQKRTWAKLVFYPVFLLLLYFNIWYTHAIHRGGLIYGDLTNQYYWAVVGRFKEPDDDTKKLLDTRYVYRGTPEDTSLIYQNNYDADTTTATTAADAIIGRSAFIDSANVAVGYTYKPATNHLPWLRAAATFEPLQPEWDLGKMPWFQMQVFHAGKVTISSGYRIYRIIDPFEIKRLTVDIKLPEGPIDSVVIALYNPFKRPVKIMVDDFSVIGFR